MSDEMPKSLKELLRIAKKIECFFGWKLRGMLYRVGSDVVFVIPFGVSCSDDTFRVILAKLEKEFRVREVFDNE